MCQTSKTKKKESRDRKNQVGNKQGTITWNIQKVPKIEEYEVDSEEELEPLYSRPGGIIITIKENDDE